MPLPPLELHRLWRALQQSPWTRLALVPAHPRGSSLAAAHAVLEAASSFSEAEPPRLVDASGVREDSASDFVRQLMQASPPGRAVVALPSPLAHPATLRVFLASDAALLCVTLEETDFTSARRTLDALGRERFVGSVTLPPEKKSKR